MTHFEFLVRPRSTVAASTHVAAATANVTAFGSVWMMATLAGKKCMREASRLQCNECGAEQDRRRD